MDLGFYRVTSPATNLVSSRNQTWDCIRPSESQKSELENPLFLGQKQSAPDRILRRLALSERSPLEQLRCDKTLGRSIAHVNSLLE
jgi:hypothetical protein